MFLFSILLCISSSQKSNTFDKSYNSCILTTDLLPVHVVLKHTWWRAHLLRSDEQAYLRGVCCWTMSLAVSRKNSSQSGWVMCWSAENGYCCTRQVSHMSSARRRLRKLSSEMRLASSGGRFNDSLRHTCWSTCTIWPAHNTNANAIHSRSLVTQQLHATSLFSM